jgi:hypothetical protein
VRAEGGYCVGPGSVGYELQEDKPVAHAPAWVLAAVARKQAEVAQAPENIVLDDPGNLVRARAFLATVPVAIQGSGGNNRAYQTIASLRELGVSQDKVPEVIADWNSRCIPPWPAEELATIANNVYLYGQNEPGAFATAAPEVTFSEAVKALPVDAKPEAAPATSLQPIAFQELSLRTIEPVREIIPGLIERGIATMLAGPGGTHKSRIALQWGLMLNSAMPIYGRTVERCTFVYLDFENGADEVTRRVRKMRFRLQLPDLAGAQYFDYKNLPVAPCIAEIGDSGITFQPFYDQLRDYLKSIPGHKFVVADSCYNVLRFLGNSKINETSVKMALNILDHLCRITDCTMVYLWHPSQAGQERGDASGWSVAWHNTPRARLSISRDESSLDVFDLKVEKRNNGRAGDVITLHWQDGVLVPGGASSNPDLSKRLMQACVRVAIEQSERGTPLKRRGQIKPSLRQDIERAAGYRPGLTEIRETLEEAINANQLRYITGRGHEVAGYYANTLDPENIKHLGPEEAMRLAEQAELRDMLQQ